MTTTTTRFLFVSVHTHCHYNVCLRQVIHLCLLACPFVRSFVRSLSPLPSLPCTLSPWFEPTDSLASLALLLPLSCPSSALSLSYFFSAFPPFLFYSLPRPLLTIIASPTTEPSPHALLSPSSFNCPHPVWFHFLLSVWSRCLLPN